MEQEKQGTGRSENKNDDHASHSMQGGGEKAQDERINPSAPEDSNTTPGTTGEK